MSAQIEERFAAALRAVLVSEAQQPRRSPRWRTGRGRWMAGAGAGLVLAAGGSGIAYAAGAFRGLPGSPTMRALAPSVTVTASGSRVIDLGRAPARTTAISLRFACLTAGTFTFADGAGLTCMRAEPRSPVITTIAITPSQDSTTVTTTPGARWRLTATYTAVTITAWARNAHGQTYGVANQHGTPDLVAVVATNRRIGYVYADQLDPALPTTPAQAATRNDDGPRTLTVYASDGRTPIGRYVIGR